MCNKCFNNLFELSPSMCGVFKCDKCGAYYTEEYIEHELLHDKWGNNWRDLFKRFWRDDEDDI